MREDGHFCPLIEETSQTLLYIWASQVVLVVKNPPASAGNTRDVGLMPGSEIPLEKEMVNHSSVLARKIPWTEQSGGLQSMESQTVGHD